MKLLIVIIVDGQVGCSVALSKRTSHTIANDGIVRFPRVVTNALEHFGKTIDDMEDEFGPIELASLGRLAAICGRSSVASRSGRIDIYHVDNNEVSVTDEGEAPR